MTVNAPTLRETLRRSWTERRAGLAARLPKTTDGSRPGLRQRLLQQLLADLETHREVGDHQRVRDVIRRTGEAARLPAAAHARLEQELLDEIQGLGPLAAILRDPTVSDVLVNGPHEIWVERFGRLERSTVRFDDEAHLNRLLTRLVARLGRHLDEASPCVDVRLEDGSRLNAVLPPISRQGTTVSIRRFRQQPFEMHELIAYGTLDVELAAFLEEAVRQGKNIVLSGGAGCGKTTLLNVLARAIPEGERIVTVEETAELRLDHPHAISLEARQPNLEGRGAVTLRDLVRNALRMRADRIIVGEVRGAEAFDMLQAMNVGHDGSLSTVHANSPRDALRRLHALAQLGAGETSSAGLDELLGAVIDLVVQQARMPDGRRRVTSVCEAIHAAGRLEMREVFSLESGFDRGAAVSEVTPQEAWS